jgi:DNA-binding IclR family transcriptional regulator
MTRSRLRPIYPVHSVERTIRILDALRDAVDPVGVTELALALGQTASAVHRHLSTLQYHGLVEQDPLTQRYTLGTRLIDYGTRVMGRLGLGERTRPHLERLAAEVNETVNLCLLRGQEALFVDKIESQEFLRLVTHMGTRVPLYCSGVGKAMLAFLAPEEQSAVMGAGPLNRYTPSTITDPTCLRQELGRIRAQGYAVDAEEYLPGVVCVAAPILDRHGRAMAAVSVSGPVSRLTPERVLEVAPRVRAAAEGITRSIAAGGVN